jgi:hypothetical protein
MTDMNKINPVAYRVDYTAEWSMGRDRFFGADDHVRMRRHLTPASIVNALYDEAALEAARQEERLQAIADFGQLQTALEENETLRAKLVIATKALEKAREEVIVMCAQEDFGGRLKPDAIQRIIEKTGSNDSLIGRITEALAKIKEQTT